MRAPISGPTHELWALAARSFSMNTAKWVDIAFRANCSGTIKWPALCWPAVDGADTLRRPSQTCEGQRSMISGAPAQSNTAAARNGEVRTHSWPAFSTPVFKAEDHPWTKTTTSAASAAGISHPPAGKPPLAVQRRSCHTPPRSRRSDERCVFASAFMRSECCPSSLPSHTSRLRPSVHELPLTCRRLAFGVRNEPATRKWSPRS